MLAFDRLRLFLFLLQSFFFFVLYKTFVEPFHRLRRLWGRSGSPRLRFRFWKASGSEARPLMVLLHGCAQSANGILRISQLKKEAKKRNFHLLVPKQRRGQNPLNCWNWFLPQNQSVLSPESELRLILKTVENHCQKYSIDRKQIWVAGLSSGAATAAGLIHEAPQVFSGALLHSGPAYASAHGPLSAPRVIKEGVSLFSMFTFPTSYSGKLILVRGDRDRVVHKSHQELLLRQFITSEERHSMWSKEGTQETGLKKTEIQYFGVDRNSPRVMAVTVHGMSHAWSGGPNLVFSDPQGPPITKWSLDFFEQS